MAIARNRRQGEPRPTTSHEQSLTGKTNPVASPTPAEYEHAKALVTDEQLRRAAEEPGGSSTEELLEELRGM